eukprot:1522448-Prymnesium_polylepis.2
MRSGWQANDKRVEISASGWALRRLAETGTCVRWQLMSCSCEQPRCCVYAAAAGALAYADGMSCTCDSSASAGSSLTSPSEAICAFLESGSCRCEGVQQSCCCKLRKQRVHIQDASVLW